jgi:heat shock protein HslJ
VLALAGGALRGPAAPAAAAATLEGTPWLAVSCVDPAGWLRPLPPGIEITAAFQAGQVAGLAGCNQYNAGYTLGPDAGAISISPAASTRIFCAEPEGVMEQEMEYLAALETAARYRIEGAQLILEQSDGARVATFDARAA